MIRQNQGFWPNCICWPTLPLSNWRFCSLGGWNSKAVGFRTKTAPIESYGMWSLIYGAVAVVVGIMITLYSPKRKSALPTNFENLPDAFHRDVHSPQYYVLLKSEYLPLVSRHLHDSQCSIHHPIPLFLKKSLKHFREKATTANCAHRGCRYAGQALLQNLKQYPELGYEVIGFWMITSSGTRSKPDDLNPFWFGQRS